MAAGGSIQNFTSLNRGPLKTTFTPPSTCLATTTAKILGYALPPSARSTSYFVGYWQNGLPDYYTDMTSDSCLPPAATPVPLNDPWYYSPAICPSGYTPAVSLETQLNTGYYSSSQALPSGVTAWLCCPSGFDAYTPLTGNPWSLTRTCTSTAEQSGPATLTNVWTEPRGGSRAATAWPITPSAGGVQSTVVVTLPTVFAQGVPIMWESTDVQVQSWFEDRHLGSSPVTTASDGSSTSAPSSASRTTISTSTASGLSWPGPLWVVVVAAASLLTNLVT